MTEKSKRQIAITLQSPGQMEGRPLATLTYQPDAGREGVLVVREELALPDGQRVIIESALVEATGNLSLAVHRSAVQPLLAGCRWDTVDPYFGIGLTDLGVLHLYLSRVPGSEL